MIDYEHMDFDCDVPDELMCDLKQILDARNRIKVCVAGKLYEYRPVVVFSENSGTVIVVIKYADNEAHLSDVAEFEYGEYKDLSEDKRIDLVRFKFLEMKDTFDCVSFNIPRELGLLETFKGLAEPAAVSTATCSPWRVEGVVPDEGMVNKLLVIIQNEILEHYSDMLAFDVDDADDLGGSIVDRVFAEIAPDKIAKMPSDDDDASESVVITDEVKEAFRDALWGYFKIASPLAIRTKEGREAAIDMIEAAVESPNLEGSYLKDSLVSMTNWHNFMTVTELERNIGYAILNQAGHVPITNGYGYLICTNEHRQLTEMEIDSMSDKALEMIVTFLESGETDDD